ncbi:hypothetical protein Tco_1419607, partial [Tanacetum coccineum]
MELDGKTVKEDEEAVKRIKEEALKDKDDPGAFIFPIILEGKVNENALADTRRSIYGLKPALYLNCTNPKDRSSAIQTTLGTHDKEAGLSRPKRPRQHETVEEDMLNQMGCDGEIDDMLRIRVRKAESDEEIFTSFDEVCADDELQTKKIIKFRLGGHAHSMVDEDNLGLFRSHTSTTRNPILRVIHKMITYGLSHRTTGLGDCEMDEEERSWDSERESILMCDLDTITLTNSIDSEGKLILEDPQSGVPKVGIPRPPRASMQDLYDRM